MVSFVLNSLTNGKKNFEEILIRIEQFENDYKGDIFVETVTKDMRLFISNFTTKISNLENICTLYSENNNVYYKLIYKNEWSSIFDYYRVFLKFKEFLNQMKDKVIVHSQKTNVFVFYVFSILKETQHLLEKIGDNLKISTSPMISFFEEMIF